MNKLSLILYFADVTDKLSDIFWMIAILAFLAYIIINLVKTISTAVYNEERSEYSQEYRPHGLVRNNLIPWVILAALVSSVFPSRETMYLIAASEVGEAVVLSPEMKETLGKIKDVIDQKLEEITSDKNEEPKSETET